MDFLGHSSVLTMTAMYTGNRIQHQDFEHASKLLWRFNEDIVASSGFDIL